MHKTVLTIANAPIIMQEKGANAREEVKEMRIDKLKLVTELVHQDLTQSQLSEKAGVSRVTISGIKCGRSCSDKVGIKIANALGVSIEELLEK